MAFDKDTKIRGGDLEESYTFYNTETEGHLFFKKRHEMYAWEHMDKEDRFQFFTDEEVDFLIGVIRSLLETDDDFANDEVVKKYAAGDNRMKDVIKFIVSTGIKNICIVPGRNKGSHFDDTGTIITTWQPDFMNEIRI